MKDCISFKNVINLFYIQLVIGVMMYKSHVGVVLVFVAATFDILIIVVDCVTKYVSLYDFGNGILKGIQTFKCFVNANIHSCFHPISH